MSTTITLEDIMVKVSVIMNETFDSNYTIDASTSGDDIDEWDSISHIELISELEKGFSVRFALGELQDLKNVGDMVSLIQEKSA